MAGKTLTVAKRGQMQATPKEKAAADRKTEQEQKSAKAEPSVMSLDKAKDVIAANLDSLNEPVLAVAGGARDGWRLLTRADSVDTRGAAAYALVLIASTARDAAIKIKGDSDRAAKAYQDVIERYVPELLFTFHPKDTDKPSFEMYPTDWQEIIVALMEHAEVEGFDDEQARPTMVNATRVAISRAANAYAEKRNMVKVAPSGRRAAGGRGKATATCLIGLGNKRHTFWSPEFPKEKEQDTLVLYSTVEKYHGVKGVDELADALSALVKASEDLRDRLRKAAAA